MGRGGRERGGRGVRQPNQQLDCSNQEFFSVVHSQKFLGAPQGGIETSSVAPELQPHLTSSLSNPISRSPVTQIHQSPTDSLFYCSSDQGSSTKKEVEEGEGIGKGRPGWGKVGGGPPRPSGRAEEPMAPRGRMEGETGS